MGSFAYEPIYVGKGKNDRMYDHIRPGMLSINNHRYNLLNTIITKVGLEEYKNNYVLKVIDGITDKHALEVERLMMSELGTLYDIHPNVKRGPLLNFTLCGEANPILLGKNNPMYNKSVHDVWQEKYSEAEYDERVLRHSHKLSVAGKTRWSSIRQDPDRHQQICESVKSGVNSYWDSLSDKERENRANISANNVKTFYETYETYENYLIEKFGLEEGHRRYQIKKNKARESMISFWENLSEADTQIQRAKMKAGINLFFDSINRDMDAYLLAKLGIDAFNEKKLNVKNTLSNAQIKRWELMSDEERKTHSDRLIEIWERKSPEEKLKWSLKYSGKNNPMFGNGHKVKGNSNGRATQWIIHMPTGEIYYCDGSFKRFCKAVLSKYKPQPHRKYLQEIVDSDTAVNGWYFKKVNRDFDTTNYIKYE
jgi:hypothetical protein